MRARHPLLMSIPHGGDEVPPEVSDRVMVTARDIFYDADALTRKLFDFKSNVVAAIEMQIARAIVDVNRAPDDRPPQNWDGVIKSLTTNGTPVYKKDMFPDDTLIGRLLQRYYFPFHEKLDYLLEHHDIKLALDCHSMQNHAPPTSENPARERPLICLSNRGDGRGMPTTERGPITCPPEWIQELAESFRRVFTNEGTVTINNPFFGGFISQFHYRRTGIPWIQIEINRKLYLAEPYFDLQTLQVNEARIQELRTKIFRAIEEFWNEFDAFC
jgi:N-formylglutamate deformylase